MLTSMGVQRYDPLVVTALNEYAERLTGDLLCDARDYANHRTAGHDLDASDIKLAVKLSRVYTARAQPVDGAVKEIMYSVNKVPLSTQVNSDTFIVRYPKVQHALLGEGHTDVVSGLRQRPYTLVPTRAATDVANPRRANTSSAGNSSSSNANPEGADGADGADMVVQGHRGGLETGSVSVSVSVSLGSHEQTAASATSAVVASEFQR